MAATMSVSESAGFLRPGLPTEPVEWFDRIVSFLPDSYADDRVGGDPIEMIE